MSKLQPMLQVLLQEMVNFPTRDNVLPKYHIVLKEIQSLLSQIKITDSLISADNFFDQLEEIQSPLSVLVFKEKIDEYPSINKFVRDFDRIDDIRMRKYMFNDIKHNNYSLSE